MSNKSKNRWLDVQLILASVAVTSTVALWNVFAKGSRPVVANPTDAPTPATPDSVAPQIATPVPTATLPPATAVAVATTDPNAPVHLPKVHLLLGGNLPVAQVVVIPPPSNNNNQVAPPNNGGGGGGGKNPPPPPPTKPASSKP